jgi:hypothetical protein
MSFDARSRERLEALGRTLPQKLPLPAAPESRPPLAGTKKTDTAPRHRLEIEQNPNELFRALIEASSDGSVPSHLLDRLRSLETPLSSQANPLTAGALPLGAPASSSAGLANPGRRPASTSPRPRPERPGQAPQRRLAGSERELYDAFDDLLHLQGDDGPDSLPAPERRPPDERLLPKPTLRNARPGG